MRSPLNKGEFLRIASFFKVAVFNYNNGSAAVVTVKANPTHVEQVTKHQPYISLTIKMSGIASQLGIAGIE